MNFKFDIFEPNIAFSIEEASGDVDGQHILAKVKGEFFFPDGTSRNKRFYPRVLWERVVSDPNIIKRLGERRNYGSIGHNIAIDEVALREGKLSHIVTKLSIVGNQGLGEILILDTPAGRILNTLLRAGSKLFVSSRADGIYKGTTEDGTPIVDPDTFIFETFDFVLEPGFLQASPSLQEQYNKLIGTDTDLNTLNSIKGDNFMSEKLLEQLAKENASYKVDLERAVRENESLKNSATILTEQNAHLKDETSKLKEKARLVEAYKALGTVEELNKMFDVTAKKFEGYQAYFKRVGSPKIIESALDAASNKISGYKKFFKEFGTPADIKEALNKSVTTVKAYKELGSIPELKECFNKMETEAKKVKESKNLAKIVSLAKEIGVSESAVKSVFGKLPEKDIRKLFEDVKGEAKISTTYRKTGSTPAATTSSEPKSKLFNEKSSGERLMESFSR